MVMMNINFINVITVTFEQSNISFLKTYQLKSIFNVQSIIIHSIVVYLVTLYFKV